MAEIWTSRSRQRQPPGREITTNSYWVNQGLQSLIIPVGNSLVDIGPYRYQSSAGINPTAGSGAPGVSAVFLGTQSRLFPATAIPGGSFASSRIAVVQRTGANSGTISSPTSGFGYWQWRFIAGGQMDIVNAGIAQLLTAGAVPENTPVSIGALVANARGELWMGGTLVAQNTAPTPGGAVNDHYIGQRGQGSEFFTGQLFLHAAFSKALSQPQMASLTANPWQLFAPERRVSYYLPASGIPTLSAATAVSITSTTATPRVTVTF